MTISVNDLRNAIAEALAEEKAYELPAVCERFGLAPGEEAEAYRSKRVYVRTRLMELPESLLLELARKVLREYSSENLLKTLRDFEPDKGFQIKPALRKDLMDELILMGYIEGNLELPDFLNAVWPLKDLPSTDSRFDTAEGDIWQHMVNNNDWTYDYLFNDYLKLMESSDELFLSLLERTVHPKVRQSVQQAEYVSIINKYLAKCGYKLEAYDEIAGHPIYRAVGTDGVKDDVKNLIFAANGPKPEIVLIDSVSNRIEIVKNAEYCLVYDLQISDNGLLWDHLVEWWANKQNLSPSEQETEFDLYRRLFASLASPPEKLLFEAYFKLFRRRLDSRFPALIPQVYLHFDPKTLSELEEGQRLPRQRMDFLILFSKQARVVIEVDGKHHYADGNKANPSKYAQMVAADRELRLSGYEMYRFGGYEITKATTFELVDNFFQKLFRKYGILPA